MSIKTNLKLEDYSLWFKECGDMFNQYVDWAFKNHTYNKNKAHKELYQNFRTKYPSVPSALVQCIRDTALEAVKQNKFKHKPKKKLYSGLRLNKCLISIKSENISVIHPTKRQKLQIKYPKHFSDFKNAKFQSATLNYSFKQKAIILNLQYKFLDTPVKSTGEIIGVDRGLYNIVTCSNGFKISGNKLRAKQRKDLFNKRNIQAKGTKSAKHKLKKLSRKLARFSKDVNHCISKQLVNIPNVNTLVFENLKNIGKKSKGKKLNKWIHSWSFYQLQIFTEYKAKELGIKVSYVDPRYTSQKCSKCGHIDKNNRNKHSFHCLQCGFGINADLNAAINIKQNYILSLTNKEQVAVNQPIVATNQIS